MSVIGRIRKMFKSEVTTMPQVIGKEMSLSDPELINYLMGKEEVSEAIFAVISRVSNVFASLPLKMIDDKFNQPSDCPAFNLLQEGPRYFTRFDFFRDIEALRNYQGNAYVQLFKDINDRIVDMALIKPGACTPCFDTDSGELYYQVSAIDNGSLNKIAYIHYKEILHFKQSRIGSVVGMDPMKILDSTLNFDREIKKISLKQLNGTNEGLKIKLDTQLSEESKKALITNVANFYRENGGVLIEENGVTIDRIQRDIVDSKLLDSDKISRARIAMVYNVPEHFIGGTDGNYSSQEQLNMEFLTYNLVPTVAQYEAELNKKTLLPSEKEKGYRYKFNVSGLLRADTQARGNFYQIMRRSGAYSANQVLMLEDMPPENTPGMNDHHISGDLYPIDMDPALRKTTTSSVAK